MGVNEYVLKEFEELFPGYARRAIEWRSAGSFGTYYIELDDGGCIHYDQISKRARPVRAEHYESDVDRIGGMSEEEWVMEFGARLRDMSRRKQIGQKDLAEITRISQGQISNYFCGKAVPPVNKLMLIAKALECEPEDLLKF